MPPRLVRQAWVDHRRRLDAWYRAHAGASAGWRLAGAGESALDLLHDAVVYLLDRGARSPVENTGGFLRVVTRSLAVDRARRARRQASLRADPDAGTAPPDDPALRLDAKAALRALDALPAEVREALWLSRFEGLDHAEIARRQGVCAKTVQRRVERALRALASLEAGPAR